MYIMSWFHYRPYHSCSCTIDNERSSESRILDRPFHKENKTGKMQNSIRKGHHIEHSSASSSHITRATLKSLFRELPKTLWLDSVGIGMQITFQVLCKCEERYQKFIKKCNKYLIMCNMFKINSKATSTFLKY